MREEREEEERYLVLVVLDGLGSLGFLVEEALLCFLELLVRMLLRVALAIAQLLFVVYERREKKKKRKKRRTCAALCAAHSKAP